MRVPFADLACRLAPFRQRFHAALDRVLDHGQVILGAEVERFEEAIAAYTGCRHAVGVANGTDALVFALKAKGIGAGDEVITTPMSYLASTSSIVFAGATPVFADVGGDLNLDPDAAERAITPRTKAILLVHLAGNPAPAERFVDIAHRHRLALVEDCAQAIGASRNRRMAGSFGDLAAFSLHPLKNLGTPGDAGVVLTNDSALADWLRLARNHGHSSRDQCEFWSANSRLDALHAAFLTSMLADLPDYLASRREQAHRYRHGLAGSVAFPEAAAEAEPSFNMFMILADEREPLRQHLSDAGVETRIHYPIPIHRLNAAAGLERRHDLRNAERYSAAILSLPLGPHLSAAQIDYTIDQIRKFYRASRPRESHMERTWTM